ncbi:MAG: aromatic aminobenezylarsenical efflux permease ArsG family transporter [bacterium]
MTPLAAIGSALWLGVLTALSPCPLMSNVAAISFLGRDVRSPRRVLAAGACYSIGRALTYVVIAMLVVSSLLSVPSLSFFLQNRMNEILGPLLVVVGIAILLAPRFVSPTWRVGEGLARRVAGHGALGATALGVLFALSFCPVSAGLFFGGLVPLAIGAGSRVVLPAAFGLGTALPVVLFALLVALAAGKIGRAFHAASRVERVARPATGVVFALAGAWLTLRHFFGLEI